MSTRDQIKKAKKGDEKAFQQLIQEEKNKLFRIAYLYVKNENDALDIVQETVYKAFISIKQLKEPNYFSTWLTRILINCALDFIRKNKNIIPFAEVEDTSEERQPIEEKLDLVEAIRKLENPYKTVIILRYYKDLTIKQIADLLNCPEGTVKTNIHRAISKLKLDLKEECIK
ncbi:sigma-70 family RNA polymerase sigma factor [Heyndrickxia oleronia]|uniref:sigma-70 family RNA polymerase sigma factor n=1 Tax=Heyndrickxia oleronia TaxID=38875 RepID=UPI0024313DA7|nr:sigma-70 family RNA polymerase sigma factor [Heyndrickxia oleronia]MCI1590860.1 sigma-70 family RNA polymerase sigma factor [Heyndrickxia oleronia]MCI1613971.1 sigma-70 family RNA polymerase sigma factor [Heyndrickxia oleronia]MCI1745206.1 sigma-70 family RNA polymerase sigma factor [Heyndrickxia oleronia]MCI1760944.1 sigma-70 family RNA polymerase sigma factor [Heyndrickxia oleronia]